MVLDILKIVIGFAFIGMLLTLTITYQTTETYKETVQLAYEIVDSRVVDRPGWLGLGHTK